MITRRWALGWCYSGLPLFFLDGDTPQAAEYARLRGEFDALEKASIQKNCGLKIERPKMPEPPKASTPPHQRRNRM